MHNSTIRVADVLIYLSIGKIRPVLWKDMQYSCIYRGGYISLRHSLIDITKNRWRGILEKESAFHGCCLQHSCLSLWWRHSITTGEIMLYLLLVRTLIILITPIMLVTTVLSANSLFLFLRKPYHLILPLYYRSFPMSVLLTPKR